MQLVFEILGFSRVKTHMISCQSSNIISLLIWYIVWIKRMDPDQLALAYGDHSGYIFVECFWPHADDLTDFLGYRTNEFYQGDI